MIGNEIYKLAEKLWPINRSITGNGVRDTLNILLNHVPEIQIVEVASGTKVFDWTIPDEWNVSEAWVKNADGKKIIDFSVNNLHLVGYSTPVDLEIELEELDKHLYSLPERPNAIPYITSYYKKRWGFCLSHKQRQELKPGKYQVYINSTLDKGSLTYGEFFLKGQTDKEILLSTYICHPSMANNELSGPCVTSFLIKWLKTLKNRRFSYRIVFVPETIGSIAYLSKNYQHMKQHVFAGFNVSCVGDNRTFSYLPSRQENTPADKVAKHVIRWLDKNYKHYRWSDRGSDERQYCAPGIDLPVASIMRTKYGAYPEYHTSDDNLTEVVCPEGLNGGFLALQRALEALEKDCYPLVQVLCEPQLGKRALYPDLSTLESSNNVRVLLDLISYSDGKLSLIDIAEKADVPVWQLYPLVEELEKNKLISLAKHSL